MPDINEYLKKKSPKNGSKKTDWDISSIISNPKVTPTRPQRRPGRGEDAPVSTPMESKVAGTGTVIDERRLEIKEQVANGEQTGSKEVAKRVANGEQTGSKETAETEIAPVSLLSQNPKRVAQRVARQVANGEQTGSKEVANLSFGTLVGKERALLLFIIEDCQNNGDLKTAPLTLERISEALGCSSNRVKNVLYRLTEKSFIHRTEAKTGRGGWTRFGVSKELFQKVLLSETGSKALANGYQTGSKEVAKRVAQRVAGPSSSSGLIDLDQNLKTTTGEPVLFEDSRVNLSPEWTAVDFSPLAEIGFTQTHLIQLAKQVKLSTAEVQASIEFFAFDLRRNGKAKLLHGSPLNFFMGILRKGIPYAPPENFETEADEARRRTREILERKAHERYAEDQRLRDLEFAEWRRALSESQAIDLVPGPVKDIPRAREASLRQHFDEQVYPGLEAARAGEDATERTLVRAAIEQSLGEARRG